MVAFHPTRAAAGDSRSAPPVARFPWQDLRMSDGDDDSVYKGSQPVEEGKSITGSGMVADDPKGPNFIAGPSMSTGTNPPAEDTEE